MENTAKRTKAKEIGRKALGIFTIPAIVVLAVMIVCLSTGQMILTTDVSFYGFTRYTAVVFLTTLVLSINLGSGRFDFSIGSLSTLSSVIAAKITYAMLEGSGASAPVMLLISIIVGAILGALSGILYVSLKLPPIITSLGVTLIYEGAIYMINSGRPITTETANSSMTFFRESWWLHLIIIAIALVAIYLAFDRSKFGYNYRALRAGQNISVNTGIKEKPNAIICYTICGALMGTVGFLQALPGNQITTSVLNFGSIGIMFVAFLPMFIGGYIGKYTNDKIGYLIAAICISLISSTFALFSAKTITASVQSIVTAALLVLFLIFLNNEQTCKDIVNGTFFKKLIGKIKNKKDAKNGKPQE
ncbi:MAG: sugar ABC transporter permease [Bacilli bacterium]|nr:sugar ABC transporter permease [Bacilli bacterium]